jgi:hypothetical protein
MIVIQFLNNITSFTLFEGNLFDEKMWAYKTPTFLKTKLTFLKTKLNQTKL